MRLIAAPLLLFISGHALATGPSNWRPGPREAWVQAAPLPFGDSATAPQAPGLLLHDRQIRITAEGDDRYEHLLLRLTVAQATTPTAVTLIGLDPRYQTLVIHSLSLAHAGAAVKVLTATQIGLQLRSQSAEAEQAKRALNPQLQISLQSPGAQAGDLLDFEYTIHSNSTQLPGLFAGHYAAQWSIEADQPVHWERLRVIWPAERPLRFQVTAGIAGAAPQVRSQAGELDIRWTDQVLAPEADTPRWFERQSQVQLSDFGDWAQVATLLAARYDLPARAEPPLVPAAQAAPALILNALRLVQDKVHTIKGIGGGPYAPADPALLLQRGYGDSRDLARLLASLLQRLGIDAQVALGDSLRGEVLASRLPSPFALDAGLVVVHAETGDYWINPAASGAAQLTTTDPADLRHALIIAAGAGRIVDLPPPALDSRLRSVTQQFDLRAGNARPAPLTVITQFRGGWAQAVSGELQAQSPAQLQLNQIQGVMQDYPAATTVGQVQLLDQPDLQRLQVTAQFRLPEPLGSADDPHFDFFAESLAAVVQRRDESQRALPLSLPWPMTLEQHIEAALPADFAAPVGNVLIETRAYRYRREVRLTQGLLHITHRYVALSDHVEAADYASFVQANAQVTQALGVRVRPHPTARQRLQAWLGEHQRILAAALLALTAAALGAWRRLRPPAT